MTDAAAAPMLIGKTRRRDASLTAQSPVKAKRQRHSLSDACTAFVAKVEREQASMTPAAPSTTTAAPLTAMQGPAAPLLPPPSLPPVARAALASVARGHASPVPASTLLALVRMQFQRLIHELRGKRLAKRPAAPADATTDATSTTNMPSTPTPCKVGSSGEGEDARIARLLSCMKTWEVPQGRLPFTLQRICEVLTAPCYESPTKLLLAFERLVCGISTTLSPGLGQVES